MRSSFRDVKVTSSTQPLLPTTSKLAPDHAGKVEMAFVKNVLRRGRKRLRGHIGATDREDSLSTRMLRSPQWSFCMSNRYVDGLATWAPADPQIVSRDAAASWLRDETATGPPTSAVQSSVERIVRDSPGHGALQTPTGGNAAVSAVILALPSPRKPTTPCAISPTWSTVANRRRPRTNNALSTRGEGGRAIATYVLRATRYYCSNPVTARSPLLLLTV